MNLIVVNRKFEFTLLIENRIRDFVTLQMDSIKMNCTYFVCKILYGDGQSLDDLFGPLSAMNVVGYVRLCSLIASFDGVGPRHCITVCIICNQCHRCHYRQWRSSLTRDNDPSESLKPVRLTSIFHDTFSQNSRVSSSCSSNGKFVQPMSSSISKTIRIFQYHHDGHLVMNQLSLQTKRGEIRFQWKSKFLHWIELTDSIYTNLPKFCSSK